MGSDGKDNANGDDAMPERGGRRHAAGRTAPEWADGLKQLYDAVVEEELPHQFLDLIARLDEQDLPPPDHGDAR